MQSIICPVDGKPCEQNCPDRYADRPQGGCMMTTLQELGFTITFLGGGDYTATFTPTPII